MSQRIHDHFKVNDPLLFQYIVRIPLVPLELPQNLFQNLCRSIVGQQLSVKAAATIFGRLIAHFPNGEITPEQLLSLPDEKIRSCGVSGAKTKSLKDLSTKVIEGKLAIEKLHELEDEQVIETLCNVRGIGRWTAEMFLIFSLGRENIFSHGDAGLRRAIQILYKFKTPPTQTQIEKIIKRWSPYKSFASRILWRSLDTEPFKI
jgi:DNA-3-methyladenine glycosylase II